VMLEWKLAWEGKKLDDTILMYRDIN
jgi:hypothetical protein